MAQKTAIANFVLLWVFEENSSYTQDLGYISYLFCGFKVLRNLNFFFLNGLSQQPYAALKKLTKSDLSRTGS